MRKWILEFLTKFENRGIKISRVNSIFFIKSINLLSFTLISYEVGSPLRCFFLKGRILLMKTKHWKPIGSSKLIRHPRWDFFAPVNSTGRGVPPHPSTGRLQLLCQCFSLAMRGSTGQLSNWLERPAHADTLPPRGPAGYVTSLWQPELGPLIEKFMVIVMFNRRFLYYWPQNLLLSTRVLLVLNIEFVFRLVSSKVYTYIIK